MCLLLCIPPPTSYISSASFWHFKQFLRCGYNHFLQDPMFGFDAVIQLSWKIIQMEDFTFLLREWNMKLNMNSSGVPCVLQSNFLQPCRGTMQYCRLWLWRSLTSQKQKMKLSLMRKAWLGKDDFYITVFSFMFILPPCQKNRIKKNPLLLLPYLPIYPDESLLICQLEIVFACMAADQG